MKKCEWCGRVSANLHCVLSLGTQYNICDKCNEANNEEICITCGEPIIGQGSIKGKCYGCSQAEYEEKQRKAEEVANGVDSELMDFYSNGVEFTEEDYEKWVTFGQGNFSPEYRKRCRQNWIREKLVEQGGWSPVLVEKNLDAIESLMEKHMSKVIDRKYMIVYYDSKVRKQKIRQFIDHIGNIFIVEKKKSKDI